MWTERGKVCFHINLILALFFYYVHSEKGSAGFGVRTVWQTFLTFKLYCFFSWVFTTAVAISALGGIIWISPGFLLFSDSPTLSKSHLPVQTHIQMNSNLRGRIWEKAAEVHSSSEKEVPCLFTFFCICPGRCGYILNKR